jgi:hypothetical protein
MQKNSESEPAQDNESELPKQDVAVALTISKKTLKRWVFFGGSVLAVLVVFVVILSIYKALPPTKFADSVKTCGQTTSSYAALDESGKGLFLDGAGENGQGLSTADEVCFLQTLKIPTSVLNRMDNTTSLMGVQTATVEDMQLEWSYHPTNGLDISFSIK